MNKITIEFCQEDRQRLDEIIAFAGMIVGEMKSRGPAPIQNPTAEHPADAIAPHGEPEPVAEPEPIEEPEAPKFTKEDILAKVQSLAGPNNPKREEAKAIIKSYGTKVSDIPADKYPEVMKKLIALEG